LTLYYDEKNIIGVFQYDLIRLANDGRYCFWPPCIAHFILIPSDCSDKPDV